MKAVILAAGLGSRINSITRGLPKCLLKFGSRTILDFQIESLFQKGVRKLAVVVGFAADQVVEHVRGHHSDKLSNIAFITNPDFSSTNNMYSLWRAKEWLGKDPFLCLNADVLCHPDIFVPALSARADYSIVIDRHFREETTKVRIHKGRVLDLKKSLSRQECSGTFVGIATFSPLGSRRLFAKAESMFASGQVNQFFNDILDQMCAEGALVRFSETGALPWAEVDDPEDLRFAQVHVYPEVVRSPLSPQGRMRRACAERNPQATDFDPHLGGLVVLNRS
ncbi:MAG: NTP transferase domain-containing protein [Acidobacteriota bacterium]